MLDLKALKQLVKTCRALGVNTFKCADYEFSLKDAPVRSRKKIKAIEPDMAPYEQNADEIPGDMPSDESLLFWSAAQDGVTSDEAVS